EESALSLAATTGSSARVIDPAMAGLAPISPNKKKIYLFALTLGFGLPLAIIFVLKGTKDQVEQQSDVEKLTLTPIIGEIPYKKTTDTLVMSDERSIPLRESFRHIRSNLQFRIRSNEDKVIIVSS